MRVRVFSLLAAVIAGAALVSASSAATPNARKTARIDVSTRAAVIHYLRSIHINPAGVVIQRGRHNYAGAHCPGKGWTCTAKTSPVVQVASAHGRSKYVCSTVRCVVVQVAQAPATGTNTAACIRTTGITQSCTINQFSSTDDNVAVVYENAAKSSGLTQTASSTASITQQATGDSNSNTACVTQGINIDGSTVAKKGAPVAVTLEAHQSVTIAQDATGSGANAAQNGATSTGTCDTTTLGQSQQLTSTATGAGAITQNENAANNGANMTIDIEQNQGIGNGVASGPNNANFVQTNLLRAIADSPAGPISQTQSSVNGGVLGTVNQDSSGVSTATATQNETQCEDAAKGGLTTCDSADPDASEAPSSLTQTQFGPVRKGVGTATQTGNPNDTFTINQTSTQDDDQGAGSNQTNVVQGDCSTSGNCTISETTNVDGNQTTNTQSGQNVTTGINCVGPSCQATVPSAPSIDTFPPNPSNSSSAEFTFSDTQEGVSFLCSLDGGGFSTCTSPQDYSDLSEGSHTFSVEAKDQNGNVGGATSYTWTIALPAIVFDGSPGTGAPPATLGGYAMTAFGSDSQPVCSSEGSIVNGVNDPAGAIGFSQPLSHDLVGTDQCWQTWSNGYTGDVYDTFNAGSNDPTEVTISLPPGTQAFYLYAEPQQFAILDVQATAQDGTSSGPVAVQGQGGAQYFGFYGINGATLSSITVTTADPTGFAVGEFGISPAAGVIQ